LFYDGAGDFDGAAAVAADDLVMVPGAGAATVPVFAGRTRGDVQVTGVGHGLECAIDRGERDLFPASTEPVVQLPGSKDKPMRSSPEQLNAR
jgi:hypothetical protein